MAAWQLRALRRLPAATAGFSVSAGAIAQPGSELGGPR